MAIYNDNDFRGSFADENVSFVTRYMKSVVPGDNYFKVMIFVENDNYITGDPWEEVGFSEDVGICSVTVNDYAEITTGMLQAWLTNLFSHGFTGECLLVGVGDKPTGESPDYTDIIATMTTAYQNLKAFAYHKTVCIGNGSVVATVATALATLCNATENDRFLSSAPYLPFTITAEPSAASAITSNALYAALTGQTGADAFMTVYADTTANAALASLGIALGYANATGTPVGNAIEMTKTAMLGTSGLSGENPSVVAKGLYETYNLQYFKTVGNNTGVVAGFGGKTIRGEDVCARWITGYITYMTKVQIAEFITSPNVRKGASTYSSILTILAGNVNKFSEKNNGPLSDVLITAPAYSNLPSSQNDIITIENAWRAVYNGVVHKVNITGNLYIGE